MTAAAATLVSPNACPSCKGPVDVRSRHVAIAGATVRIYCSEACLRSPDGPATTPAAIEPAPPRRRWGWWLVGGIVLGTTSLAIAVRGGSDEPRETAADMARGFVAMATPVPVEPPPAPPPKPEPDPDAALLDELVHDAWIHPLAGPSRRMPVNHNGAFGAERPGERPPECVSGHCGVDLGNSWGEPVHAVHDGVVDWVNRGPNDEHGGVFVKIAHRGGTLYSWYFHLAAVPRSIQPGVKVTAGQVIGLLGDTGVARSGPHLHFSLTVKPSKTAHERYIDPEPLIAIWPLWIANENASHGRLTTAVAPGLPVREPDRPRPKPEEAPAPPDAAPEAP